MDLNTYIRDIKNFPSEGIVFKDITPLLNNVEAMEYTTKALFSFLLPKNGSLSSSLSNWKWMNTNSQFCNVA